MQRKLSLTREVFLIIIWHMVSGKQWDNPIRRIQENGSKGARTLGLPLVRRALIPAELCFHVLKYNTDIPKWEAVFLTLNTFKVSRSCALPTRNPLSGKPPVSAQNSPLQPPGSAGSFLYRRLHFDDEKRTILAWRTHGNSYRPYQRESLGNLD